MELGERSPEYDVSCVVVTVHDLYEGNPADAILKYARALNAEFLGIDGMNYMVEFRLGPSAIEPRAYTEQELRDVVISLTPWRN